MTNQTEIVAESVQFGPRKENTTSPAPEQINKPTNTMDKRKDALREVTRIGEEMDEQLGLNQNFDLNTPKRKSITK